MITRTRTVSILDSSKLPFLLRTGKVQQNAQDRGEGQWQVPHGGFTSQLKYRQNAGRFEGELAGFTFCRYTPVDGSFNGRGRAQLPHLWLFETGAAVEGLLNGSGQSGSATGWTPGAGSSVASVATSNPENSFGTALKLSRATGAGTGTVSISQASVTTAGAGYIISGAVSTTSGNISIKNGTSQIWPNARSKQLTSGWSKVSTPLIAFPGSTSGDSITIECTDMPESVGEYLLASLTITSVSVTAREVWLCDEGASYFAVDLDALKARALARIRAATTYGEYEIEDGDLVCTSEGVSAFLSGPVPWVCGWGYIRSHLASTKSDGFSGAITNGDGGGGPSLACMSWANAPGAQMPFSQLRAYRTTPVAKPDYAFESSAEYGGEPYHVVDFERLPWVALRNTQGVSTPEMGLNGNGDLVNASLKKNHSEHRYYWQANPDTSPKFGDWETLYNATSVPRLRYFARGGVYLQPGDIIKIAGGKMRVTLDTASGVVQGARAIEVEGKTLLTSDVWTANVMHGAPSSIAWMVGWYDYFEQNPAELPEGSTMSSVDPHPIRDVTRTRHYSPTKMIKEMLGDDQDVGLPLSMICTTVCDLFGRYDSDRQLIDFAALARCVKAAGLKGARYQIEAPEPSTDTAEPPKETNLAQLISGLCQTHGIKMVWAYRDSQRSWVLTFRPDTAQTVADAALRSRVIDSGTALLEKPTEVIGGDFNYSAIKAKYKQLPASEVTINVTDPSGRIQHTGPRALTINDAMTVLPSGRECIDQLGREFGNRVLTLSFLSSRLKLATTIKSASIIRVGDSIAVDVAHLRNPKTGRQDGALLSAEVNSASIDLGKAARVNVEMTLSRLALVGISPSLDIDTWTRSGSAVSVTGLATDPANNDYAPTDGGLTDLATFGCYSYDDDRGMYLRACGCGAYACYIARRGVDTWQDDVTIWPCTVSAVNVSAGTCTVTLASGASAFPASNVGGERYVLFFAARDNASLQQCQIDYYGWLGNNEDVVVDSTGAESAPATVG